MYFSVKNLLIDIYRKGYFNNLVMLYYGLEDSTSVGLIFVLVSVLMYP